MNRVAKTCVRVLAVLALLAFAKGAYADEFSFAFSAGGDSASGTLTTDPESGGSFLVTSISGTFEGFAMTLLTPNNYGGWENDNLVYPTTPYLDGGGLGFSANGTDFDIYYSGSLEKYFLCVGSGTGCLTSLSQGTKVDFGYLTPVMPAAEPGSAGLVALGLLGLVWMIRRKHPASAERAC